MVQYFKDQNASAQVAFFLTSAFQLRMPVPLRELSKVRVEQLEDLTMNHLVSFLHGLR